MAHDYQCCVAPWWHDAGIPLATVRLFGSRLVNRLALEGTQKRIRLIEPHYYYNFTPQFAEGDLRIINGVLRGGLTVAGCALQLAAQAGIKEAVLIGVDFQGQRSFDGSVNPRAECRRRWPWLRDMQTLCKLLSGDYGMKIMQGSPSALKLSPWHNGKA
jgi:hypothetical protein